jgi:type I restriction enzyme S subunit
LGIAKVPLCTNQGCKSFVCGENIDYYFLYYNLKKAVPKLQALGSGATFSEISKTQLESFEIPLPPLPEQKRIAAILNEQVASVEKVRKATEQQLEAAKTLPAAYLRSVFNSPEAQKWPSKKLETIGNFESGGTPSKEKEKFWDGDIPFVTGADITDFYISKKNARAYLSQEGLNSGKTAICTKGTILFVTRTRVGRVGIATEIMGASQDLSPYICGAEILPEYACRYLLSISDYLTNSCRGATIQGLTRNFIRSIEIPLPPIKKQKIIAETLDKQIASAEIVRETLNQQLDTINKLPAALLKRAFNGEL